MEKKNSLGFDINVSILPNGDIQMIRFSDIRKNELMKEILLDLVKDEKGREEIEYFYKEAEKIELIVGDRIMCG